jgi:hypothetical protein
VKEASLLPNKSLQLTRLAGRNARVSAPLSCSILKRPSAEPPGI